MVEEGVRIEAGLGHRRSARWGVWGAIGPEAEAAIPALTEIIARGPEGIIELVKAKLTPESLLERVLRMAIEYIVETLIGTKPTGKELDAALKAKKVA
jgi:hypothetical protein